MKKLLKFTQSQVPKQVHRGAALTMTGLWAERIHVNDPIAIGIEEFLRPVRFESFRLSISHSRRTTKRISKERPPG